MKKRRRNSADRAGGRAWALSWICSIVAILTAAIPPFRSLTGRKTLYRHLFESDAEAEDEPVRRLQLRTTLEQQSATDRR